MAIYGYKSTYANQMYGETDLSRDLIRTSIGRIQLGLEVRKSIGKRVIFRLRRGNGYFFSEAGKIYQDKYKYFVPDSIYNIEGEASRSLFASAVAYWKNTLSDAEKKIYNQRANRSMKMSGYNLFIREVMLAERTI
jgi:hypothetical protein